MDIIGVDFSGREKGNTTWICEATLTADALKIECCYRPSTKREDAHDKLKKKLRELNKPFVAAMDFPFSVPKPFAEFWERERGLKLDTMPDLWRAARHLEYKQFEKLRDSFVQLHGELLRNGDVHFGGPLSPLKNWWPQHAAHDFSWNAATIRSLWVWKSPFPRSTIAETRNRRRLQGAVGSYAWSSASLLQPTGSKLQEKE